MPCRFVHAKNSLEFICKISNVLPSVDLLCTSDVGSLAVLQGVNYAERRHCCARL